MKQSLNGVWDIKVVEGITDDLSVPTLDETWSKIDVPGCWEAYGLCKPTYHHADSLTGYYRTTFSIPDAWKGQRIVLRFDGVLYGYEDEAVLSAIGASGDYDRMLNFIMNERTRELLGEWNRWDELARTCLLVKRAKAFNPEAAPNVQDRHMYRPIPQKFIDALQNEDGSNLSDAEKKAWQNPGY